MTRLVALAAPALSLAIGTGSAGAWDVPEVPLAEKVRAVNRVSLASQPVGLTVWRYSR